jgi:hypothetical protein
LQYQWGQDGLTNYNYNDNSNNNISNEKNTLNPGSIPSDALGSAASQKAMSSYFIPKDSVLNQDEVTFLLPFYGPSNRNSTAQLLGDGNPHSFLFV